MARHKMTAVVSIAWFALCATPWIQCAGDMLRMIPEEAWGAVVFNRLAQTDAKIQGVARQVRLEALSPLSPLSHIKSWLNIHEGLNEQGNALLVLIPPGDSNTPPAWICYLPVTDYDQFLEALQPQTVAKISTVNLPKGTFLVANRDDCAVLAEPKYREILEKALEANQDGTAIAPFRAFLTDNDIAILVLQNGVESWWHSSAATTDNFVKNWASLREQDDATVGAIIVSLCTPAVAMLELYGSILRSAGKEIDSLAVGAHITAQGDIRVSQQLRFQTGCQAAKLVNQMKAPEGNLLSNLPAGPYVFAAAGLIPDGFRQCLAPSSSQTDKMAPKSCGFSEEQIHKLREISLQVMQGVRGCGVMVKLGNPEEPLCTNLLSVTKVNDAATYIQDYEHALQAIQELIKGVETSPQPTLKFKCAQFDGTSGLEVSSQNLMLPGVENIPGFNQLMENLTRRERKIVAYIAPADEHTIMVAYMHKELLLQGITSMKSCSNLSQDEQVAQTAAMLPQRAEWIAFWSPEGLANQWNRILVLLPFLRSPDDWRVPELPPTPPIGFAVETIPDGFQAELIVPAAVIQNVGRTRMLVLFLWGSVRPRSGEQYVYRLKEAPKMLTEDLALEKAKETFAKEGYKLEQWCVTRADMPPSQAPDGTPDKYFHRFTFLENAGRVHFTNGKEYRAVEVRLDGDRLVCFMFYGL